MRRVPFLAALVALLFAPLASAHAASLADRIRTDFASQSSPPSASALPTDGPRTLCPNDGSILQRVVLHADPPNVADGMATTAYVCQQEDLYWVHRVGGIAGFNDWYGPFTLPRASGRLHAVEIGQGASTLPARVREGATVTLELGGMRSTTDTFERVDITFPSAGVIQIDAYARDRGGVGIEASWSSTETIGGLTAGTYTLRFNEAFGNAQWEATLRVMPDTTPVGVVPFDTIDRGAHSGLATERNAVIRSESDWRALWREHTGNVIPPPPLPHVDFSSEMVLARFMGTRNSGGYRTEIGSIVFAGRGYIVNVQDREPAPGSIVTMALTSPFHIVRTALFSGQVNWNVSTPTPPPPAAREVSGRVSTAGGELTVTTAASPGLERVFTITGGDDRALRHLRLLNKRDVTVRVRELPGGTRRRANAELEALVRPTEERQNGRIEVRGTRVDLLVARGTRSQHRFRIYGPVATALRAYRGADVSVEGFVFRRHPISFSGGDMVATAFYARPRGRSPVAVVDDPNGGSAVHRIRRGDAVRVVGRRRGGAWLEVEVVLPNARRPLHGWVRAAEVTATTTPGLTGALGGSSGNP